MYLIIDCTELFIEKSSQIIQQSATWSEYKGHNTGKALIALSPIMLPVFQVFVSEVYPGVSNTLWTPSVKTLKSILLVDCVTPTIN